MATNRVKQWQTFARMWWLFDARWQSPFVAAPVISHYLQGKWKPIYHPLSDLGDHVVVINCKDIAMRNEYWRTYKYYHHTGYGGGLRVKRAYQVHDKDPTKIMYTAVYQRLSGNLLRRPLMKKLHLFEDDNVPEDIMKNINGQLRQVMPTPRSLGEYTEEERKAFPRLFEWPQDAVYQQGGRKTDGDYEQ